MVWQRSGKGSATSRCFSPEQLVPKASPGSDNGARFYNALVEIDGGGQIVDAVDKVHLVPFGEYLPFEDMLSSVGIEKIVPFPMSFSEGNQRHALTLGDWCERCPSSATK